MENTYNLDDIQSLSAAEQIRKRPKLYFEKCFYENSLDSLLFEVLCHAFDEYFDGKCNTIEIEVYNDSFQLKYDAGMSLKIIHDDLTIAEIIMTKIAACKNQKKHLSVGEEFCELGMATINFASESCELTTISKAQKGIFSFKNGETLSKKIIACLDENESTKIYLKPNKALFDTISFTSKGIEEKAKKINSKLNNLEIKISDRIK